MAAPATFSESDLVLLAKMLRLLGSDQAGERAAAAWKVHQLITTRGLDWDALLQPGAEQAVTAITPPPPSGPRTWADAVEQILGAHFNALRGDKEAEFVSGLLSKGLAPSERQAIWLADICDRAGVPLWDYPPPPDLATRQAARQARRAGFVP